MILKICGLTRPEDVALCLAEGVDVLGFITGVPESKRSNSPQQLASLLNCAKGAQRAVLFRNSPLKAVLEVAETFFPEIIHLCGNEDFDFRKKITERHPHLKIWQSVGVPLDAPNDLEWVQKVADLNREEHLSQIVLDSAKGGKTGGTGLPFPFAEVANQLKDLTERVVVAGGLCYKNLPTLMHAMKPAGVDISSGVESKPGQKDAEKIRQMVESVRKI